MQKIIAKYQGKTYELIYNESSGYYEVELQAPDKTGIFPIELEYEDSIHTIYRDDLNIQVLKRQPIKLNIKKVFMWIFNYRDFSVKDIVELANYEINIDEETNETSIIDVLKKTTAKARDIVAIKKNNEFIYWGTIQEIQNENGNNLYQYIIKYITNLFDRQIELKNEELIKTKGIEDFLQNAIQENFTNSTDSFINLKYLTVKIKSHTIKQVSVTNVENRIYNFHTWLSNCTQNYDIVYSFEIEDKKLIMNIENKSEKKQLIDTRAMAISNYSEVFETDVTSKVTVLTSTNSLTLFLLNDRTTTTDANNRNRADGKITTVYTENFEDAMQTALDVMKSNSYNHNISFNLKEIYIKIGTPIAIKTKESLIYDTYISSIKITPNNFIEYQCGNIRTKFIEKILQERKK